MGITKVGEMDELRDEVQEFQERWNSMVLDITEDLKITCDEAQTVHGWIAGERQAYAMLKEKINLEMRESSSHLQPYQTLMLAVDELARKADEMEVRAEQIIAQCQGKEEAK